jgi:hypothetical protein
MSYDVRHTLKLGGSWNYYRSESYYPGNNGQNGFISYTNFNFTGQAIGDFLRDQVSRKGKGSTSDAWTHLSTAWRSTAPTTSRSTTA